jgi:hypothetical protein
VALPNFLIIGAQKAGTTTLFHLLRGHPAIFMPAVKEPGFFIRGFPDPARFQTLRRPDDGRTATPVGSRGDGFSTLEEYSSLFEPGAASRLRGEASTPYLPSPYAAGRIAEVLPDVRLIVILRDPVERAFSAYNYNLSRGTEPARTFDEAVASELSGERDDWVYGWRYLYTGRYAEHLGRYLERFSRERIAVFRFEAVRADSGAVFADACRFLGVEPVAGQADPAVQNPTVVHPNPVLRFLKTTVTASGPAKRMARAVLPGDRRAQLGKSVLKVVDRFGTRPASMSEPVQRELRDYFRMPNEQLSDVLEMDFGNWNRER